MESMMKTFFTITALFAAVFTLHVQSATLEVIGTLDKRPGNPAIGPNGEIYLSMSPFDAPEFKVVRLSSEGKLIPFPTAEISRSFVNVIGISSTTNGIVWILDMGNSKQSPKLFGWSVAKNELESIYYIPLEATGSNPFFQDLAIDIRGEKAFIADMSRGDLVGESSPAIVVVDLKTGATRRVLEGHKYFQPKTQYKSIAGEKPMIFTGTDGNSEPVNLGLNPIAIDEESSFVTFSTITPGPVYQIPASVLGDFTKSDDEIEKAIFAIGGKATSDGIAVSGKTVYLTNVENGSIESLKDGVVSTVIKNQILAWPDGIAIDRDGSLIVTVNQLHKATPFNGGTPGGEPPYYVVRIRGDENE